MTLPRGGGATVWNKVVPIKVRIHYWRLRMNRLPTKEMLTRKGVALVDDLCPLCQESTESREHIFVRCRFFIAIRAAINTWWNIMEPNGNTLEDLWLRLSDQRDNARLREIKEVVWHTYLWCIWNGRNAAIFSNTVFNSRRVANDIQLLAFLWIQNRSSFGRVFKWVDWCCNIASM